MGKQARKASVDEMVQSVKNTKYTVAKDNFWKLLNNTNNDRHGKLKNEK